MIISKTKKYRIANIIISIGSILSSLGFLFALEKESSALCYIASGFLGVFVVSSLSVGLDFGCEVSYPVPANNVTGVMISYSMIISSIHILIANFIFTTKESDDNNSERKNEVRMMVGVFMVTVIMALIFSILSKEDLRRKAVDTINESSTQILSEVEDE